MELVEKLLEWRVEGIIVLYLQQQDQKVVSTATEEQLRNAGIFYDQLVMGLPAGPRVLS